ncbi:MAG: FAD-dependent oxidoreductase, partial [Syntrophales bacterium]|nr:FAD-dependent oxidoreductase [Syntrophales bacterium]
MDEKNKKKDLFDDDLRGEIKAILADLPETVRLIFFGQRFACPACREQRSLLEEVAGLSEKVKLEIHDTETDKDLVRQYSIDKVPATVVTGLKDYGIRFYGITGGYEFGSLLEAIILASRGTSGLNPALETLLQFIDRPVHLEIMVTLTCPYCPHMVHLAHQMAVASDLIRADMVESSEFPHLVQRHRISGVPWTIINDAPAFQGALPAVNAVLEVLKVGNPEEYERIDAMIRQARGERHISEPQQDHEYEVIIVGAGPAAFSAGIYAARKGLDLLLVGNSPGGQLNDTALVENWLGIANISGPSLSMAFQNHLERHVMAQQLHVTVKSIERMEGGFLVTAADGRSFRSRCLIYCAGKEYKRLEVPGEGRFLGKGIAFCATCDAPLFKDRSVAIIGGGNSAFTAARDLLHYAKEIHIVNIVDDFQADEVLVKSLQEAEHVKLHHSMRVVAFLGVDNLSGVRLESTDGLSRLDLPVEGVFLEIGLTPNSKPEQNLLALNEAGEIPVNRDQSTSVP